MHELGSGNNDPRLLFKLIGGQLRENLSGFRLRLSRSPTETIVHYRFVSLQVHHQELRRFFSDLCHINFSTCLNGKRVLKGHGEH